MLGWVFGDIRSNVVNLHTHDRAAGYLEYDRARVKWFLSINYDTLPEAVKARGLRTYRSITLDGEEIEFSDGFTELHTRSYEAILRGEGYGVDASRKAIETVYGIRGAEPIGLEGNYHKFCEKEMHKHPFKR